MAVQDQIHDAQKILSDLRDHLARPDRPLAFLFGAGTSCCIHVPTSPKSKTMRPLIPAVMGLTEACRREAFQLGEKFNKAWKAIEAHCATRKASPNVEDILSQLRMMLSAVGKQDTLAGLNVDELQQLEATIRKTIANVVAPELDLLPNNFPQQVFARWLSRTNRRNPVEIFTLNYDVLIEHGLEKERVPLFDGFVGGFQPFFHPDSLRYAEAAPASSWTRLWKMHGSVTWSRVEQDGRKRIVRGTPNAAGEMIYPSYEKYDESRQQPYSAFADRLRRFLDQDDALLVISGFSFGDEHINDVVFSALESKPRTHVYAVQFDDPSEDSTLLNRATKHNNVIVIGPTRGVIGGKKGTWLPTDPPAFMAEIFELQEEPGSSKPSETPSMRGFMKIGDFAVFCRFLEEMART